MATFIVLLRGVNVGGHNRVPMAELRAALGREGFANVRTYVNSGNVVLEGTGTAASVEARVEAVLAKRFKVEVPVVARTARQWASYAGKTPFPKGEAKLVHLGLTKKAPDPGCVAALRDRATAGEQIVLDGDAVWIDFAGSGVARSKLTPAFLDKACGSPLTARNWNTVQALAELARAAP